MKKRFNKISFFSSFGLHAVLIALLVLGIETTIRIPAEIPDEQSKQIIDAVMINKEVLNKEITRLKVQEKKKRDEELEKEREIVRKEKEIVEKRKKEEALLVELKKKNEQLKKEAAEQLQLKKKKDKEEKERLAKEKKQKEEDRKKLEKEKEEALAQKKLENEQKEAEERIRQQANIKVKQNEITQHAMLIKSKINRNWRQPLGFDFRGFTCEIAVKLMPTGEVIDAVVTKSSGNVEFDRSTELAIRKASPLPMPANEELAKEFRQFTFTFRPEVA